MAMSHFAVDIADTAALATAAASAASDEPRQFKTSAGAAAAGGFPLWRQVFLRRARIKHLLQHEWFADVCTAHATALEENRRLIASHASILAVRSAAAAQEGVSGAAGTSSLLTEQRLLVQSGQDAAVLKQQVRTVQAAAAAAQRQYEKHRRHLETQLLLLQQQVQQQQQVLAEKDRELLHQQRLLREKEEEVSEKEAQAAATRRTCLLLVQQQQQQQQAVQKAQQEVAAKALETEGYLRELLRYKQAEAASLELLQQQIQAAPQASADRPIATSVSTIEPTRDTAAAAVCSCTGQQHQEAIAAVKASVSGSVSAFTGATPTSAAARAAEAAIPETRAADAEPSNSNSNSNRRNSTASRGPLGRCRPPLRLVQSARMHTGAALCCCCRTTAAAGDARAAELFVSGGADGTLAVRAAASGRSLYSFVPSPLRAACTAVDLLLRHQPNVPAPLQEQQQQEAVALVGCMDATLYVAQLPRGKVVETLKAHAGSILACGFMQPQGDTTTMAAASTAPASAAWSVANDRSVRLWDLHRSACSRTAVLLSRPTAAAAAESGLLLVGHRNGTLGVFSPSSPCSGKSKGSNGFWVPDIVSHTMHNSEAIVGLAISNDRHTVCTLGEDKTVQLWDLRMLLQHRREQQVVLAHPLLRRNTVVASPCFSPCGRMLAAATGNYLLVWNMQHSAGVQTRQLVESAEDLAKGRSTAVDGDVENLLALRMQQPQQKDDEGHPQVLHCADAEICCLSWSSSSSRLFAGCRDGTVLVWE
ncbi:WD-repeat protein, putative [Eimeria maxima]|uniref:WD-repeat protein, putative n=1 Tax=Eimeria maxima TaxID=5804 RepID=U6M5K0_EIMMA|nr:WD-repeat protein, putative [Eimeria maxima]CDJ58338.1 WD-repeat protein, putative [Eimeria maxima]